MADANVNISIQLSQLVLSRDAEIDTDGMGTTPTGTAVRDHNHNLVGGHRQTYLAAKAAEEVLKAKARANGNILQKVRVKPPMMIRTDVKVKVKVKVKDAGGDVMIQDTLHLLLLNPRCRTQTRYLKLLHQWKNGNPTEKHKSYGVNEMNYSAGIPRHYGAHAFGVATVMDNAAYHIYNMKMRKQCNNDAVKYVNSLINGYVHQVLRLHKNHRGKTHIDKTSPAQRLS